MAIVTSNFESFSLTILESFSNARPVVAFDVDYGPKALIESGRNGFLVTKNDVSEFAEKIIEIMSNDTLRHQMCANAKATSLKYSYTAVAEKWKILLGLQ